MAEGGTIVANETYKMTNRAVTQKETGSAFDATIIKSDRAGTHVRASEADIDAGAFAPFPKTTRVGLPKATGDGE